MQLFICEKSSLAAAVAENLGKAVKKDGYFEVGEDCVAWLRGHIMALKMPEEYNPDWKQYKYETLPIIPETFEKVVKTTSNYPAIFKTIDKLLKKADVVVNVGDPDREGQLLVDEVLEHCQNKKPTKRLLVNAMDDTTIKRALASMEDNNALKNRNMYKAALGRECTDWLIGINASRKYSLDSKSVVKVGRVKVPMLALVARRNELIDNFTSIKYYELKAFCKNSKGTPFMVMWQPKEDCPGKDEEGRIVDVIPVRECMQKIDNTAGKIVSVEKKKGTNAAPLLFSLSTLQRAAGPVFGFSPAKTLEIAQSLYEKKLTTYPRSDSNYLPDSQYQDAKTILDNLKLTGNSELETWAKGANGTLKSSAYNTKKVDAHHAIIPTMERVDLTKLSNDEQKLYVLIAKRFILQFYPVHEFEQTVVVIECEGEKFVGKGKIILVNGWKGIEKDNDADKKEDEDRQLPEIKEGESVTLLTPSIVEKNTTPPARFTQDTLIGALTNAHKYVNDTSLREVVKDIKGIGTEATRSSIMEDLIKSGMLIEVANKKKKELFVSDTVKELLACLPDELTYPDMTALMEVELDKVAKGEITLEAYLEGQIEYVRNLMTLASKFSPAAKVDANNRPVCPVCGTGKLYQHEGKFGKFWNCSNFKNGCKATFNDDKGKPAIYECPVCKKGILVRRKSTKNENEYYWSCNQYQNGCKAIFSDVKNKPIIKQCPKCKKGYLIKRHGKNEDFYGCNNYPDCSATYESGKTGLPVINKTKK